MTTVVSAVGPDATACDLEGRIAAAYSPTASTHSQYSTYSREIKYIFNPITNDRRSSHDIDDDYADYSHIVPKGKQGSPHYMAHTPRSRSHTPRGGEGGPHTPTCHNLSSSNSNTNQNLTPCNLSVLSLGSSIRGENGLLSPRDDFHRSHSRTSSVLSTHSRDRGPIISPCSTEALNSFACHGQGQRSSSQGHRGSNHDTVVVLREKNHFSPIRETPPPTYQHAKNYSSFRINPANTHNSGYSNWPSSGGSACLRQGQEGPRRQDKPGEHFVPHPHPPYPQPPRYTRRKTWSPPILKLNSQDARVCLSNDSLDHSEMAGRAAQRSYSDDLDSTPPRLAPVSGVLAQKPGHNLVRPIAFKPIHTTSPNHGSRRPSVNEQGVPSPDLARPLAVKLGTGVLGHRASPEKSTCSRPQQQVPKQIMHGPDLPGSQHSGVIGNFRSPNANSSSYQNTNADPRLNSSANSHHNVSSTSSQHSVLATSHHHHPSTSSYLNSSIGSHHNSSAASSHMSCAEDSFSADMPRPSDRADSVPVPMIAASSSTSRGWHQTAEGILQTPSPSDSGVGELEAILREKDAEINTLREVMDRNERAILQVYEERKNAWAQDAHELRDDYERKLKVQSRKSYKTEQVLSLQVYKLQQEHKSIIEDKDKIANERDSLKNELEAAKQEISTFQSQLELKTQKQDVDYQDLPEEVALKNKEIISLRAQLHSVQSEVEKKNKEISDKVRELTNRKDEVEKLRGEVERLQNPIEKIEASSQTHAVSEISNTENVKPSMMGEREKTIQGLQDELLELRGEVLALKDEHDRERDQWLDEKNKVVRYQKQLQLNYVQMQRKNTSLETEVQQLTLELENRDMKLIALSGEESVC